MERISKLGVNIVLSLCRGIPMKNNYPTITISNEGETWLQKGQMWMYRNNLSHANENIPDGAIVNIISNDGTYYGNRLLTPPN